MSNGSTGTNMIAMAGGHPMGNLKSQTRSIPVKSKKIARQNNRYAQDVEFATQHLTSLIFDIKSCLPSYRSADVLRDVETIGRRLRAEGMPFVTTTLPVLSQGLFDLMEGRRASFPSFKIQKGAMYPQFLGRLFRVALNGSEADRATAVRGIYNLSVAFKKLKGPYKKSVLVQQYNEFVATDQELGDLNLFTDDRLPILDLARKLMSRIISNIDIDTDVATKPRPGPGATNTPREKHLRYRPHVLYTQVERHLSFWDGWYNSHPWDIVQQSGRYMHLLKNMRDEPSSRFKFVPKTAGKARGICIEENEIQFLQQGIRRVLTAAILDNGYLKNRIALDRQSVNATLALQASKDRSYATIDMSEASDRISRDLVSWLFQDNPRLHNALMALSTRWIEPPKEVGGQPFRTHKFAPMGSAICFPVMSLVHFVLCRAIILLSSYVAPHDASHEVYVYGDDIIIPTGVYKAVTEWLPRFGMKLNLTKSFVQSHFRESCGIHAIHGIDITPVYVKHIPNHRSASQLLAYLAVERDLEKHNFYTTAKLHRRAIQKLFGKMPFVSYDSPVIGFKRPMSFGAGPVQWVGKKRWNRDYQQWEYSVRVVRSGTDTLIVPTEEEALLRWHLVGCGSEGDFDSATFGDNLFLIAQSQDPFRGTSREIGDGNDIFKIRRCWLPASAVAAL